MSVKTYLDTEIEELFNALANAEKGSQEYAAIEKNLIDLLDRSVKIEQLESSDAQAEKQYEIDLAKIEAEKVKIEAEQLQAEQQAKYERKSRLLGHLINIGAIVLPLIVTIWGAIMSWTFEEKGTITSSMGRKFMDKLLSKK